MIFHNRSRRGCEGRVSVRYCYRETRISRNVDARKEKNVFWVRLPLCCRHWVLAFDYARRAARSRGERTAAPGNTMEWNGTERNGRSVTKYQLSPYHRATLYIDRLGLQSVSPSSSTFIPCHRHHRILRSHVNDVRCIFVALDDAPYASCIMSQNLTTHHMRRVLSPEI